MPDAVRIGEVRPHDSNDNPAGSTKGVFALLLGKERLVILVFHRAVELHENPRASDPEVRAVSMSIDDQVDLWLGIKTERAEKECSARLTRRLVPWLDERQCGTHWADACVCRELPDRLRDLAAGCP